MDSGSNRLEWGGNGQRSCTDEGRGDGEGTTERDSGRTETHGRAG